MYIPNIEYILKNMRKLSFPRVASSESEKLAFAYVEEEAKPLGLIIEYQKFDDDWIVPFVSNFVYKSNSYPLVSSMVYKYMELSMPWGFSDSLDTDIVGIISNNKDTKAIRAYESIKPELFDDPNAIAIIGFDETNRSQIACTQLSKYKYLPCFFINPRQNIQLQENELLSIQVRTHKTVREFTNMIIRKTNGNSIAPVIIGAHIDTFPGSPGASDDAFGVGMCLDIVRQCGLDDNIWIVLFTGEEIDRRGSRTYIERYINAGHIKPRLYINIDSGVEAGSGDIHIKIHPEELSHDISAVFNEEYAIENEIFQSDDSVPFSDNGTPVFWVWAKSPQRAHSIHDTVDNVDVEQLNNIAKLYSKAINQYIGLSAM